jgi:uncharacterized Tic20 family protein
VCVLHFLASGLMKTVLFLLPLILLPLISTIIYRLRVRSRPVELTPEEQDMDRLNFNILRYVVYLPTVPAMILVSSLLIALASGLSTILDSMIWLSLAIMLSLGWSVYRLVTVVSTRTRLQEEAGR